MTWNLFSSAADVAMVAIDFAAEAFAVAKK